MSTQVLHTVEEMRKWRAEQRMSGAQVGLVATMGALHSGHLHLVQTAATECTSVVVSIFVNPAQFAPHEDLQEYPRTLSSDIAQLQSLSLPDTSLVVFAPRVSDMYPRGISTNRTLQRGAFIEMLGLSEMLEGGTRPHFFRGVCTVVAKLFHATEPHRAYFGQKDVQQCCVIKAMVDDLLFPLHIKVVPTVRDKESGLALSSRNVYLTREEKERAPAFYHGLCRAKELFESGVVEGDKLLEVVREEAEKCGLDVEYVCLSSPDDLQSVDVVDGRGAILSGAWRMGSTRLIDNILLGFEF
ncbi:pantoate-beta-alanine ligase [Coemansia sp. RSA 532]|nr:pantoate-beta-alanine ligase [Coemansia sp. RSA 532]KAJ2258606.1 pantoate-beta-alanine ligase [Coemansia sp. RSA 454]KAJ2440482.1 pantoate-beta-alanine ligase [Coemansia sp. RSA 2440]